MTHPQSGLFQELLDADLRRDRLRFEECQRFLKERGWLVEKCDPPRPVREQRAEAPPPIINAMSPAQEAIYLRDRPRNLGPGVS